MSALKQNANAYAKLAAAAASGNKSRLREGASAVQQAEQSLAGALDGLEAAGYKIALVNSGARMATISPSRNREGALHIMIELNRTRARRARK